MKPHRIVIAGFASLLLGFAPSVHAQLSWDTNTGTAGAQGGTGNWTGNTFWNNGAANVAWANGSSAIFGGTAGTVTVNSAVIANALTFNATGYIISGASTLTLGGATPSITVTTAGQNATISAVLGGTAGFTTAGSGNLILSGAGANTYSGTASVSAGTLTLNKTAGLAAITGNLVIGDGIGAAGSATVTQQASDQIADSATVTVAADGLWNLATFNRSETIAALVLQVGAGVTTGTGTLTVAGNISATGSSILSTPSISGLLNLAGATRVFDVEDGIIATDLDISAVIANGGITKTGAGRMALSGANTFANAVTINAGILSVSNVADTGVSSSLGAGSSVVFGGGTLSFTSGIDSTDRAVTLNAGGGTIDVVGAANLTFSGAIGGVAGFAKTGTGTLTLSGAAANTYSGTATLTAGTLNLNKTAGLSAITGDLVIGDGTGAAGTTIVTQGANDQIGNTGNVTVNSDGTWNLASGNRSEAIASLTVTGSSVATGSGTLTVAGNVTGNASSATATISGLLSLGSVTRVFNVADGAAASDLTISAVISSGGITKTGAGTLTLTGANTFSSSVNFNDGTISVADATDGGVNGPLGTGFFTFRGGTLSFTGGTDSMNRGVVLNAGGGTIEVTNAATVLTMSGNISGPGGLAKTGPGTLLLGGANTYGGSTGISTGTLRLSGGNAIGDFSATTLANSAGVVLDLNGTSETIGSLSGGGVLGGNVTLGSGTLSTGVGTSTTYDGVISGTGGLIKLGFGTLTLTGASSFTGTVTISNGTISAASIGDSGVNSALGAGTAIVLGHFDYTGPTASTNRTLTLSSATSELDVSSAATTLTISGNISGSSNFIKSGPGILALNGVGSYSGATLVTGGVLRVSGGSAIPDASDVSLSNTAGAALDLNGSNETIGLLSGGGGSGGNVLLGSGTLTTNSPTNGFNTFAGTITGSGGLTKTGNGTLNLTRANSFTGPLTINGGVITASVVGAIPPTAPVVIASGAGLDVQGGQSLGSLAGNGGVDLGTNSSIVLTVGGNGGSTSYGGEISGDGSLVKVGAGTMTLTGFNSYAGPTTINGGLLRLANAFALFNSSTISLADTVGAAFEFTVSNGNIRALAGGGPSGGNVILSGGGVMTVGGGNLSTTYAGAISGNGGLSKTGVGTLTLSGTNTFGGPIFIDTGKLRLTGGSAAPDAAAVTLTNPDPILELSGSSETIGSLSGAVGTVQLNGGSLTTGGNGTSTTFSGIFSGTGGLTKAGAGIFTMSGVNTYSGPTTITAGTLRLVGGAAVADDSPVTLVNAAGATLDLDGVNETIASLSGGGALGGNVTLGSGSLTVGADDLSTSFGGVISGTGGVIKIGAGALTLNGVSTFSGATQINAGTLRVGVAGALPSGTAMTIGNSGGATFDLNGIATTIGSLAGSGDVTLGGGVLTTGGNGTSTTYSGVISGAGASGLMKTGAGTFTLSGANTYTGVTTINEGTLRIGAAGALRDTSRVSLINLAVLDLNGIDQTIGSLDSGSGVAGNVTLGAGTLTVGSDNSNTTYDGVISGNGGLTKTGTGTLTLTRDSTFLGPITIQAGTISVSNVGPNLLPSHLGAGGTIILGGTTTAGTLAFTGGSDSTENAIQLMVGGGVIDVSAGGTTLTVSGGVSGAGSLTKLGGGRLTLNHANSYTGATMINAGALRVAGGNAIGDSSAIVLANVAGAVLELNGSSETIGSLAGGGVFGGGSLGGNVTLGGGSLTVGGNDSTTYNGAISGTGSLIKSGTGILELSGVNTFTGTTAINGGVLRLNGAGVLADTTAVVLANTAGVALELVGATSEAIGSLAGGGSNGGDVLLNNGALTISDGLSTTYAGVISGHGDLRKFGFGTLTLTGANSYTGDTIIFDGRLVLDKGLGTPGGIISIFGTLQGRNVINRAISGPGTITATGTLLIGDAASTGGFNHGGLLNVGTNLVTLLDADAANLGTSTILGPGGRLDALNGISLLAGRSLTASGSATISTSFVNNGTVNGPGGAGKVLTFTDGVSGAGNYSGNILFSDGFSPGNSPALVTFSGSLVLGNGTLTMELGGLTRGTQYDSLNIASSFAADGTLALVLFGGYSPVLGDTFDLFDAGSTSGTFDSLALPTLAQFLAWDTSNLYTTGTVKVTTTLTPIEQWRLLHFGSPDNVGGGADGNDFDNDGSVNLLEYALGMDPKFPNVEGLPVLGTVNVAGSNFLTLTIKRPLSATDISYRFQVGSTLLPANYGSLYTAAGDVPSNVFTTEVSRTNDGTIETIVVRDNTAISAAPSRFLRLKVSNP